MRVPSRLLIPVAFVAGIAGGLAFAHLRGPAAPGASQGVDGLRRLPTAELGAELMGRVGRTLVADNRGNSELRSGIVFFDTPKPHDSWLCRVNAYAIPPKVIAGKARRPQEWWEDDLTLVRRYAIWRRPTAPEPPEGARDRACAAWRDFANTFSAAEDGDPGRAAYLLDVILTDARAAPAFRYPASCTIHRDHSKLEPRPCDAKSVLRRLSLRQLRYAKTLSFAYRPDRGVSRDELTVVGESPSEGKAAQVVLTVDSEQHWGRQSIIAGDVKAVEVAVTME